MQFLKENSFYTTADEKAEFIKNKENLTAGFLFGFLGMVAAINASDANNRLMRYFKKEKKLFITNINDENQDLSLSVKLLNDAGYFIKPTTVYQMTKFLAKIKNGNIKNVDNVIIHDWLDSLKPQFALDLPVRLRGIYKDFRDNKRQLHWLAYYLRLNARRFPEVSGEFLYITKVIKFKKPDDAIAAANTTQDSTKTNDMNDSSSTSQLSQIVSPPLPPNPSITTTFTPATQIDTNVSFGDNIQKLVSVPSVTLDDEQTKKEFKKEISTEFTKPVEHSPNTKEMKDFFYFFSGIKKPINSRIIGTKSGVNPFDFRNINDKDTRETYEKLSIYSVRYLTTTSASSNVAAMDIDVAFSILKNFSGDFDLSMIPNNIGGDFIHPFELLDSLFLEPEQYKNATKKEILEAIQRSLSISDIQYTNGMGAALQIHSLLIQVDEKFEKAYRRAIYTILSHIQQHDTQNKFHVFLDRYIQYKNRSLDEYARVFWSVLSEHPIFKKYSETQKEKLKNFESSFLYDMNNPEDIKDFVINKSSYIYLKNMLPSFLPTNHSRLSFNQFDSFYVRLQDKIRIEIKREVNNIVSTLGLPEEEGKKLKLQKFIQILDKASKDMSFLSPDFTGNLNPTQWEKYQKITRDTIVYNMMSEGIFSLLSRDNNSDKNDLKDGSTDDDSPDKETKVRILKDLLSNPNFSIIFDSYKEIAYNGRGSKPRREKYIEFINSILSDTIKEHPKLVSAFFDTINDKYTEDKIRERLSGNVILGEHIQHSSINPFADIDDKTAKKLLAYNKINLQQLLKESRMNIRKKKGENIVDYLDRVNIEASKNKKSPIIDPFVEDKEYTQEKLDKATVHLNANYGSTGRHGNYTVKITKAFNASVPSEDFDEYNVTEEAHSTKKPVIPAFHGTGGIAASMITRYGFRDTTEADYRKSGPVSTAGAMLGPGLYISNVIDKSALYCSNGGYLHNKRYHNRGYVFLLDVAMGPKKSSYDSDGLPGFVEPNGRALISPEWCLKVSKKQTKIVRVFELELVPNSEYENIKKRVDKNNLVSIFESNKLKSFSRFLKEDIDMEERYNFRRFVFTHDQIPILNVNGTVEYKDLGEITDETFPPHAHIESFGEEGIMLVFKTPTSADKDSLEDELTTHLFGSTMGDEDKEEYAYQWFANDDKYKSFIDNNITWSDTP